MLRKLVDQSKNNEHKKASYIVTGFFINRLRKLYKSINNKTLQGRSKRENKSTHSH